MVISTLLGLVLVFLFFNKSFRTRVLAFSGNMPTITGPKWEPISKTIVKILKWTIIVLLGILVVGVGSIFIASQWGRPDSYLPHAAGAIIAVALLYLFVSWYRKEPGASGDKKKSEGSNRSKFWGWIQASGLWIVCGALLFIIPVVLFGQAGWDLIRSPGYWVFIGLLMFLAIASQKKGGIALPLVLFCLFLLIWASDSTPQGFWKGVMEVGDDVADDYNTKVRQAKWLRDALKVGAVNNGPTRDQHLVTAASTTVYRPFDKTPDFTKLCGKDPCINPPNAKYWNGDVQGAEKPLQPVVHKTVAPLPPFTKRTLKPESNKVTGNEKPLLDSDCIKAASANAKLWHNERQSEVPVFTTWTSVAYYKDIYRWGHGNIYALRQVLGTSVEIEVANRCP